MSESPVQIGEILAGKYQVERILGVGGMGIVVAATHLGLGQLVALKFMLPTLVPKQEPTERFLREARVAVKLRSQHSARVLDVGVLDSGAPYLVMELLEGHDLASLVTHGVRLPVEDAVEYMLQVCEAMGEAHQSGIVHRDLKPANLFLTTDAGGKPCVKVLDFGVSKLMSADLQLTGTVQALGSPLYMSPEQMKAARDVDGRSDIWALGVVLFELLTGITPFHAESLPDLCLKVFSEPPIALTSLRPDAPAALMSVILGCLEKDRARRFQSMAALAAALAPFAPPRARIYAERVASIQGVALEMSRPTDVLPPEPARYEARSAPSLYSSPAIAETAAIAQSLPLAPPSPSPSRRWAGALAAAVAIVAPIAVYLALRSPPGAPVEASSIVTAVLAVPAVPAVPSSAAPSGSAEAAAPPALPPPLVDVAPSATAPPAPKATATAAPGSGKRPPAATPPSKAPRPDYEGPRR